MQQRGDVDDVGAVSRHDPLVNARDLGEQGTARRMRGFDRYRLEAMRHELDELRLAAEAREFKSNSVSVKELP